MPHYPTGWFLPLLTLLVLLLPHQPRPGQAAMAASIGSGGGSLDPRFSAEDQVDKLREEVEDYPENPLNHVKLAMALHELNHRVPDGGSRVPEAEKEYR